MALTSLLDAVERLPAFARLLNTLPEPGATLSVGGLAGSSDAVLLAALARRLPSRFFVLAADGVAEAERWLSDLDTLTEETPVALYPPREGFGEAEPHMEVAGERMETLERLKRIHTWRRFLLCFKSNKSWTANRRNSPEASNSASPSRVL